MGCAAYWQTAAAILCTDLWLLSAIDGVFMWPIPCGSTLKSSYWKMLPNSLSKHNSLECFVI